MHHNQFSDKLLKENKLFPSALSLALLAFMIIAPAHGAENNNDCAPCLKEATSLFARGKIIDATELLEKSKSKCQNSAKYQLLLSTLLARRNGMKKEAAQAASLACKLDPTSKGAHLQLGICLISLNDTEGASLAFESLVQLDPTSYEGWSSLGQLYLALGKEEEAKICAKKAACLEPESREAKLKVVTNLFQIGKLQEAKAELARLNNSDSLETEFYILVADRAREVGAWQEALKAADKVLSSYPQNDSALQAKAEAEFELRQYQKCLTTAAVLKTVSGKMALGSALLSLANLKLGNLKEAKLEKDLALKANANEPLALVADGIIKFRDGSVKGSLDTLQESLADNQIFAPAHMELSQVYIKLGDEKLALDEAKELSRRPEHKASALAIEGQCALLGGPAAGSITRAKQKFNEALKRDDNNPIALLGMSQVSLKSSHIEDALVRIEKALKVEPGSVDALLLMSRVQFLKGNKKLADKYIKKARLLAPGQGDVLIHLSEQYIDEGVPDKAVKLLKSNLDSHKDFPPLEYTLAKILNENGDKQSAYKHFKSSLNKGLTGKNANEADMAVKEIGASGK